MTNVRNIKFREKTQKLDDIEPTMKKIFLSMTTTSYDQINKQKIA